MKRSAKHDNETVLTINDFTGGLNYAVTPDQLGQTESQRLENFELNSSGMLVSSGGLRKVYTFSGGDIETLFSKGDGDLFFSSSGSLYITDLSSILATYTLSGSKLPSYCRFDKKIVVCSGGAIQYYDKKDTDSGLQTLDDDDAPEADAAFVKDGRVIVYNAKNDYFYYCGIGDITDWIFASASGITNPTKITLAATTDGSLETAYHVDVLTIYDSASAAGDVTLTFDGDTAYTVSIDEDDSASTVAQKIATGNDYDGWTVARSSNVLTFTANKRGSKDQLVYDYGDTEALGTVINNEEGSGIYQYKVSAVKNTATAGSDPVYAETAASEVQEITLTETGGVKLSWSAITDAVKYKIYGRTEEELTLLKTTTDTSWTDDGSTYNLGTDPPTTNSTTYTHTDSDAAKVKIGYKDDGFITAVVMLSADIVVFKNNGKIFRIEGDYPNQSVYSVSDNAHCQNRFCAVQSGNNAYFYGQYGLKDLGTVVEYGSVKASDIGAKIDKIACNNAAARMWYLPSLKQLWLKVDNSGTIYVYNFLRNAYSVRKFNSPINDIATFQNAVYVAMGSSIYLLNPLSDKEDEDYVTSVYKSKRFRNDNEFNISRIHMEFYCIKDTICYIKIGKYEETITLTSNSPSIYNNTDAVYNSNSPIWVNGLVVIDRKPNFNVTDFDITIKVTKGLVKIRNISLVIAEL
ncbi:MAG: hypothetical protein H6Q67_2213 [Firmicutes bacterium]|nr:hypothetical protein [Bacillota bacterium]